MCVIEQSVWEEAIESLSPTGLNMPLVRLSSSVQALAIVLLSLSSTHVDIKP